MYRFLLATRRANDLRVFDEGGLYVGVKAGKFWDGGTLRTYVGSSGNALADDQSHIYIYLNAAGELVTTETSGWPGADVRHVRLAIVTTADGDISQITDARDHHLITACGNQIGAVTSGGITTGAVVVKVIEASELKALLDGNTNNLFTVRAGDMILGVRLVVETAAGSACSVSIGVDADAGSAGADVDALLKNGDANATGIQASDEAGGSFCGDALSGGAFVVNDDGKITITASSDISSSGFIGRVVLWSLPR